MWCCFCLENAAKGRSWQKLEIFQSLLARIYVFESPASGKKAVWSTVILILIVRRLEDNLTWGIIAWVIIRKCENETVAVIGSNQERLWFECQQPMHPLQLSDHVLENRRGGDQMMHWDMLNKENSNLMAFFNLTSASFALQFGDFVPCDR